MKRTRRHSRGGGGGTERLGELLERAAGLNATAAARIQAYLAQGGRIPPALVKLWESTAAEIRQSARTRAELEGVDPEGALARVLDDIAAELGIGRVTTDRRLPRGRSGTSGIEIVVQGAMEFDTD